MTYKYFKFTSEHMIGINIDMVEESGKITSGHIITNYPDLPLSRTLRWEEISLDEFREIARAEDLLGAPENPEPII